MNNAINNNTLKKNFEKTTKKRDFRWNKQQNFIFYLTHVINLMIQNFIATLNMKVFDDDVFAILKNIQLKNIKISKSIVKVIKKTNFI